MQFSYRRLLAALLGALALAACQPTLKSQLPVGDAAYQSINATTLVAAPAGAYLLRPGDRIAITVYQEPELTQPELALDETGTISVPLVGDVHAAGRSTAQLAAEIQQAYGRKYLRDPQVNVSLKETRTRTFSVEGEVNKPGQFVFEPGNTLLTAIAVAGSPAREARLDEVLVFRNVNGQRMGGRFDLTGIRAGRQPDPQILAGDVIVVGFSAVRGAFRDILQAAPLLGLFRVF